MSEKNTATANNEQTALTTGGFAALANADALNNAAEDLAGLDLTFDRIKNHLDNCIISGKKPKNSTIREAQYQ